MYTYTIHIICTCKAGRAQSGISSIRTRAYNIYLLLHLHRYEHKYVSMLSIYYILYTIYVGTWKAGLAHSGISSIRSSAHNLYLYLHKHKHNYVCVYTFQIHIICTWKAGLAHSGISSIRSSAHNLYLYLYIIYININMCVCIHTQDI